MVNLVANTNSSSTSVNKTKTTSSSNSSVNALPQTDERSQHAEMATGFVGLLLAVLGFVGISFRKRRN
jgi:LPXTG-motif cell wall-anchored protein